MIQMVGIEKGYDPVESWQKKHFWRSLGGLEPQREEGRSPGSSQRIHDQVIWQANEEGRSPLMRLGLDMLQTNEEGRNPLLVLRGVNLHIRRGDYAAIVGPSGSGKSTLMHILGCLDTPACGVYRLDGVDVSGMDAQALCLVRREKIGFVFQGFQLLPKLTALENVAFPLMLRGMPDDKRLKTAKRALDNVGLGSRMHHRPGQLSGGQQQRVALARALCYEPKLLLCDEPTGALDGESRDEVLELFSGLHRDGHTVVVITHDAGVASRAVRRFRVDDGRVFSLP